MEPYVSCLISVIVHIVMTRMRRNGELRLQRFMSNVYEKYMNFQIFLFLWSYIRKRCYNQVSDWALLGKSYAVFMYDKHNLCYTGSMYFGCQFDRERSHGIYPEGNHYVIMCNLNSSLTCKNSSTSEWASDFSSDSISNKKNCMWVFYYS